MPLSCERTKVMFVVARKSVAACLRRAATRRRLPRNPARHRPAHHGTDVASLRPRYPTEYIAPPLASAVPPTASVRVERLPAAAQPASRRRVNQQLKRQHQLQAVRAHCAYASGLRECTSGSVVVNAPPAPAEHLLLAQVPLATNRLDCARKSLIRWRRSRRPILSRATNLTWRRRAARAAVRACQL